MTGNKYFDELPRIDRDIICAVIDDALAAGHVISVNDGEEWTVRKSADRAEVIAALVTTDADTLSIRDAEGVRVASVYLVYGNEPGVVICDHTDTPAANALLARANALAEAYSD